MTINLPSAREYNADVTSGHNILQLMQAIILWFANPITVSLHTSSTSQIQMGRHVDGASYYPQSLH